MPALSDLVDRITRALRYLVTPDDVFQALNEAGFVIYTRVLKENKGFFVKFDETSVTLTPGVQEYTLPSDCDQIAHLAERLSPQDDWRAIQPEDLDAVLTTLQDVWDDWINVDLYEEGSPYLYYGPYLDAQDAESDSPDADSALQSYKIRIAPAIDQTRAVQIVYTAKWLPIVDATSPMVLPAEAMQALFQGAMASLCLQIDDTRAPSYDASFERHTRVFLTWVRDRQLQRGARVEGYLL